MPQTLAQFGQTIKAKHPEYADMADEDVGSKVLAKYPEYHDMVSAPVAGAGDLGTPQPAAHPAITMRGGESNLETIPSSQSQPGVLGAVQTGVHNFGARVANNGLGLLKPVLHPIQTGSEILQRGAFPLTPGTIRATQYNPSGPDAGATAANVLGDIATAGLLHAGGKAIPGVLQRLGSSAQDSGIGVMDKTIGTLKNDFKRGTDPARGYFEAGNGPSLSMQSLADKGAASKAAVGSKIGSVIDSSKAVIPLQDVHGAIQAPLAKGIALETGPGGMGNTDAIERYAEGLKPALQGTVDGGLTPRQVFDLKRGIAQNTNWSDPSQFNLKAIRQQQAGGLSGVLNDNIPELRPLNSQYGDLNKFAARAASRAETGSMPLTSLMGKTALSAGGAVAGGLAGLETGHSPLMTLGGGLLGMAADSVPVKSTLASGLYYGGQGAGSLGRLLASPSPSLSGINVTPYDLATQQRKKDKR